MAPHRRSWNVKASQSTRFPQWLLAKDRLSRFSRFFCQRLLAKNKYRIYSRISRRINDKIMPQKLGGATYSRAYTSTPPRSLTPAVLECYNCSLKTTVSLSTARGPPPSPALLLKVDQCVTVMSAPIAGHVGLVSCSHICLKWLRESDRRKMLHLSCAS